MIVTEHFNSEFVIFIPFAVETTGGISQDAKKLIDQLSLACKDHLTLPSHHTFSNTIPFLPIICPNK